MKDTEFYCPECEAGGHRSYLTTDGMRYRCERCDGLFSRDDLHNAYMAELANLEADANFVRQKMVKLCGAERKAA